MNFLKNKKKLIFGISIDIFICVLAFVIFSFHLDNKTIETSSSDTTNSNKLETNNVVSVVLGNTFNETDSNDKIPEIVTDEKASEKELKEEKVTKKEEKKSTSPYYIKVNYGANVVTIYKKDKNDKYTVPYKAMVCSCGTFTPKSGTYKTSSKYRWGKLIHDVYGQYATRIVGSILFHSVPYSSNTNDTLLYNQYDKLGTTASAGCIRLTVKDAKWIYENCPSGTLVEFYKSSDPGPLGKPTAQKITSIEECRNWDPTDPASGNPWHTYKPEEENTSSENVINNSISNTINSIVNNTVSQNTNNSININTNSILNENTVINNTITNNSISTNNTITNNTINNSITSNNTTTNNINTNNIIESNSTVNNINNVNQNTNTNNTVNNLTNSTSQSNNNMNSSVYNTLIYNNAI